MELFDLFFIFQKRVQLFFHNNRSNSSSRRNNDIEYVLRQ